jgi:hypothetical protein
MKNKFKIGDKVRLTNVNELNTGIPQLFLDNMTTQIHEIKGVSEDRIDGVSYVLESGYYFNEKQLF